MLNLKNLNVIFDSNAYRDIAELCGGGDIKQFVADNLIKYESKNGIVAAAYPYTFCELASHLHVQEKKYEECKQAIVALSEHCLHSGEVQFVADSESTESYALFGVKPLEHQKKILEFLKPLAEAIHRGPPDNVIKLEHRAIDNITSFIKSVESAFIQDMWQIVTGILPSVTAWGDKVLSSDEKSEMHKLLGSNAVQRYMASAIAIRAMMTAGIEAQEDFERTIDKAENSFRAAIALYIEVLRRSLVQGANMTKPKNANFIWDMQIAEIISDGEINGRAVCLVTTDQAILDAANDASLNSQVISLSDYLQEIKA